MGLWIRGNTFSGKHARWIATAAMLMVGVEPGSAMAACTEPHFNVATPAVTAVDPPPTTLVTADFNHDSIPDVAGAPWLTDEVAILLGTGDGGLQVAANYGTSASPLSIAAADIDRDGEIDLVTANWPGSTLSIFLGRGDGSFSSAPDVVLGPVGPVAVTVGDFDGDDVPDLALASEANQAVLILPGLGDGTFGSPTTVNLNPWFLPMGLATGDFNGDGRLDIAVGDYGDETYILTNAGGATFSVGQTVYLGGLGLAATDLDRDGDLDLASIDSYGLEIAYGDGSGSFTRGFYPARSAPALSPNVLAIGDLNADDVPDVVVADEPGVSAFVSNGNGGRTRVRSGLGGRYVPALLLADITRDGRLDLMVPTGTGMTVLPGHGDGTFDPGTVVPVSSGVLGIVAGDFDVDGAIDVAAASSTHIAFAKGRGLGQFASPVALGLRQSLVGLAAGDFDGNGRIDLATSDTVGPTMWVLADTGMGPFDVMENLPIAFLPTIDLMAAGDLNSDGKADLVTATSWTGEISILLAIGGGRFAAPTSRIVAEGLRSLTLQDVNNDDNLDVVTSTSLGVSVLAGIGTGSFGPPTHSPVINPSIGTGALATLALGDIDEDGNLDVAAWVPTESRVHIFHGDGLGAFTDTATVAIGEVSAIGFGDFNNDAHADLATISASNSELAIALGTGTTVLGAISRFEVGASPWGMAIADVNDDGSLDVLTGNMESSDISVLLNTCVPLSQGTACQRAQDCDSGHCVDGVCCDSACGGGLATDCQACSKTMGATTDGTCGPASSGTLCRPSTGACDIADTCDGSGSACGSDLLVPVGETALGCRAPLTCDGAGACRVGSGYPCDGPGDCASGSCVDGVCDGPVALPTSTRSPTPPPTSTPTPTRTLPPTKTRTRTPTPRPTATPRPLCPDIPSADCFFGGRGKLALDRGTDPRLNRISWDWSRGISAQHKTDFGDPLTGATIYALCLYDYVNDDPVLAVTAALLPRETCRDKPCWKEIPAGGWKYSDPTGHLDGLTKLMVKGLELGRTSVKLSGRGALLPLPTAATDDKFFEQSPSVVVQLRNDSSAKCWSTTFDATSVMVNDARGFKARTR